MIKEYCDRCSKQVGNFHDGGKHEPKYNIDDVVAITNSYRRKYTVCKYCMSELTDLLSKYFKGTL